MGFWACLGALWVYDRFFRDDGGEECECNYELDRIPTFAARDPDVDELLSEAVMEAYYDDGTPYETRMAIAKEFGLPDPPYPLHGATDCVVEEIYEC